MENAKRSGARSAALQVVAALLTLALMGHGGSNTTKLQACLQSAGTGSVMAGWGLPVDPAIPEAHSGYKTGKLPVIAHNYMAVTANPLATRAGCEVLHAGGTAVDAAVAIQAVLGLVEPQSSGLGGGGFMLHYNASSNTVQSYDGRETTPLAATENYLRHISNAQQTTPLPNARASGRSIGVPGVVRMLEAAHRDHGGNAWSSLFGAGIKHANDGFAISERMAAAISGARNDLLRDPEAAAYFLNPDYSAKALGTTIKNPAYAATLDVIAKGGANAFYTGPIAQSIVDKVAVSTGGVTTSVAITPGQMAMSDLANYQAIRRTPVCSTYRTVWVCGMGPPSSGGIAVAQTLGILNHFDLSAHPPTGVNSEGGKPAIQAVHLVSEAQRLAYADRNKYVADTDFVPLHASGVASMINATYLRSRANLITTTASLGTAVAGYFPGAAALGSSAAEGTGTSHVSVVDRYGNVVVMTTTIESGMGSFHFTRGFLLNNELTDFSAEPSDAAGPIANRVQPGKRPRSSMSPTLVFNKAADGSRGDFYVATGSPGGAAIIQFVVKTVVSVVDWKLDAQQATSMVNFGAANSPTTGVGGEHPAIDVSNNGLNDPLLVGLRSLGHTVSFAAQSSGLSTIIAKPVPQFTGSGRVLEGGADPRREGIALGDGLPN